MTQNYCRSGSYQALKNPMLFVTTDLTSRKREDLQKEKTNRSKGDGFVFIDFNSQLKVPIAKQVHEASYLDVTEEIYNKHQKYAVTKRPGTETRHESDRFQEMTKLGNILKSITGATNNKHGHVHESLKVNSADLVTVGKPPFLERMRKFGRRIMKRLPWRHNKVVPATGSVHVHFIAGLKFRLEYVQ